MSSIKGGHMSGYRKDGRSIDWIESIAGSSGTCNMAGILDEILKDARASYEYVRIVYAETPYPAY
jgi:hypothetical protein